MPSTAWDMSYSFITVPELELLVRAIARLLHFSSLEVGTMG